MKHYTQVNVTADDLKYLRIQVVHAGNDRYAILRFGGFTLTGDGMTPAEFGAELEVLALRLREAEGDGEVGPYKPRLARGDQ